MAAQTQKSSQQKEEARKRNIILFQLQTALQKCRKKNISLKNACYSVTKYYLCKRNNKRSLSGRKQRLEVVRSFPNRYQFSCINKVTSLFSDRYIFIIILDCNMHHFAGQFAPFFTTHPTRFAKQGQTNVKCSQCHLGTYEG